MADQPTILVAGVGNTLRGDDGIGAYIAQAIGQLHINGVDILQTHQLQNEQVEEFLRYDRIVIADATVSEKPIQFYELETSTSIPVSTSHHVNPALLALLAQQLYQKKLPIMICAVQGIQFDLNEQLSPTAKRNADEAINLIIDWIKNGTR